MDATLTNARRSIKLGSREFLASPLSDRDISELDEWIQEHYIDLARRSLRPETNEADRELTLRVAMKEAMALTWLSGQGAKIIGTVDGLTRLLWQMIHRNHPGITTDQLRSYLIDNVQNARAVNDAFEKLNIGPGKSFQVGDSLKKRRRPANRKRP